MKRVPKITEEALPVARRNETANVSGEVAVLMRECARLKNQMESERYKADKWKRELLLEILEVMDSMERIQLQVGQQSREVALDNCVSYVQVTAGQLSQVLTRREIVPFDTLSKLADPELTEIMDRREQEGCQEGVVIEQVERGYTWEGKRLRRSKVVVAKRQGGV